MGALCVAGLGFVAIILLFVLAAVIGGLFIWIAAKLARVENATFGKAVAVSIASSFVFVIITVFARILPIVGDVLGFIIWLILAIIIIKAIFDTSFAKAIVVWIFQLVAVAIAFLVVSIIAASAVFLF